MSSQTLLIDADDTLWENNIYFERAIARFISFLNHHEFSPEQVREVLNDVERECIVKHGYGLHSFAHALLDTFERLRSCLSLLNCTLRFPQLGPHHCRPATRGLASSPSVGAPWMTPANPSSFGVNPVVGLLAGIALGDRVEGILVVGDESRNPLAGEPVRNRHLGVPPVLSLVSGPARVWGPRRQERPASRSDPNAIIRTTGTRHPRRGTRNARIAREDPR